MQQYAINLIILILFFFTAVNCISVQQMRLFLNVFTTVPQPLPAGTKHFNSKLLIYNHKRITAIYVVQQMRSAAAVLTAGLTTTQLCLKPFYSAKAMLMKQNIPLTKTNKGCWLNNV